MAEGYCTHMECKARAIYELKWIAHVLPHRADELAKVANEIDSKPEVQVRCRAGFPEPAPLPDL